jgi:hypothetical protein
MLLLLQTEVGLKVYIYDKEHHVLSLKDVDCRVILEIDGIGRKTLPTQRVETEKPAGRTNHGGDVDDRDGYWVEFVLEPGLPDDDPHVEAKCELSGWICPMRCQYVEKQGKCPKCGMAVERLPYEFTAVVVFRINGEPRNVRFRVPPKPATVQEAVEMLETRISRLAETDRRGPVNAAIGQIAEKLADLGAARLGAELEELAKSNAPPESYKDKLSALRKFIKEPAK